MTSLCGDIIILTTHTVSYILGLHTNLTYYLHTRHILGMSYIHRTDILVYINLADKTVALGRAIQPLSQAAHYTTMQSAVCSLRAIQPLSQVAFCTCEQSGLSSFILHNHSFFIVISAKLTELWNCDVSAAMCPSRFQCIFTHLQQLLNVININIQIEQTEQTISTNT